jgi:hypothetical protein
MEIQFAVQSYTHESKPISAQRCINAYAEFQPRDAKSRVAVIGCPGIDTFATIGSGPIRGALEMKGVAYFVSQDKLYSVDSNGVGTLLGSGITGYTPVSMDGDGFEVVIVNGVAGFSYRLSDNTFQQISDPDFKVANSVTVINNYFVFDEAGTNRFTLSDLLDGRNYLDDFATAESAPDRVLAVRNHNGLLLVFGEHTIEPWDHTGATDFPFSRIKGSTIDRGLAAPLAIASEDTAQFFLGEDRVFYRLGGLQRQRVSTHAIERTWSSYTKTDDAFCFKYGISGHKFIYLTFPTEGATWGLDLATGFWHERMSYDVTGAEVAWRANCAIDVYNKTLIGDANSNKVGFINPQSHTEFGQPIIMTLVSPPIFNGGRRMFMPMFELDMETGVGIATGQGSDPQVMLDWSDDGGYNFAAPQLWNTMGVQGARMTRLQWTRLGSAYQRSLRVSISDPVRRVVTGAR